jgi:hypothetical protein
MVRCPRPARPTASMGHAGPPPSSPAPRPPRRPSPSASPTPRAASSTATCTSAACSRPLRWEQHFRPHIPLQPLRPGSSTPALPQKKKSALPVGPVMLGFFLFVVVGSGELRAALGARDRGLQGRPLPAADPPPALPPQPCSRSFGQRPRASRTCELEELGGEHQDFIAQQAASTKRLLCSRRCQALLAGQQAVLSI